MNIVGNIWDNVSIQLNHLYNEDTVITSHFNVNMLHDVVLTDGLHMCPRSQWTQSTTYCFDRLFKNIIKIHQWYYILH